MVWRIKNLVDRVPAIARQRVVFIAITLIFICLVLIAYVLRPRDDNEAKELALLKEVYKNHRSIESRIADFTYAPFISTRGEEGPAGAATHVEPWAQSHRARGLVYLLNKRFDKAIREFENALVQEPSNAKLQSDLGAALLEKGKEDLEEDRRRSEFAGKPIEELSRGVEHIHKALDLDASFKEAIFNLGLLQEQLGLRFAARDSFSKYLEVDANSGWAYEARERISRQDEKERASSLSKEGLSADFLDTLNRKDEDHAWKLLCENRSPLNGKYISELLVDAFIDQSLNFKKKEAANSLSALSFLAELEVRRAAEHYCDKLVEFYKSRHRSDLARLKQARDFVKQGHDLYLLDKNTEAIAAYADAKNVFDNLKDRCESLSAEYRIAYCHSESHDAGDSLPVFERLAALCEKEGFKLLQVRNLLGIAVESSQKKYSKTIRHALRSLEIGKETGDELSAFTSLGSLTEFYRAVGNYKKALTCIENNIEYSSCPAINQLQNYAYYSRVASALSSAGYFNSSLEYRKEALKFLMRDMPRNAALYFIDLGATYTKLKKYAEAEANFKRSYEEAQAISPESLKNMVLAYVTLNMGSFHRDKMEFQDAVSNYNQALNLSLLIEHPTYAYQAHKGRMFCYLALGEDAMAEKEISETLRLLESSRSEILEQENRNSFFDAEQGIYDLAIDYECSRRNNFYKAFDYSEESRSRSLLDLLKSQAEVTPKTGALDVNFKGVSRPLTSQEILELLPEHLQVIQYSVLADKIIVWVLSPHSLHSAVLDISQEELNRKVTAYLGNISHYSEDESADISTQSKELFNILIKPLANFLSRDMTICIAPDKALNKLPFETLISTETQGYLIQDFPIIYSPSSSVLIECIEEAKRKTTSRGERLLGVGNPRFDYSLFRGLSDLPAAEREIEKIAEYYDDNVVLTDGAAREGRVRSEMQKATVIHLATHTIPDEDSPLRSKVLLAKETTHTLEGNDGVIESHEIYETKFPNTRLVVLSSCQSGIDRYYNGEGMMSLARSFMAAGVPTVVASLWKVDSNAAADLMVDFHRFMRRENLPVAESLRRAKLNMLKDQGGRYSHPYFWSGFITVGSQAVF